MKDIGIYIHIPFCIQKCAYCDFLSWSAREDEIEEYVNILCAEIAQAKEKAQYYEVQTIFLGGGTPSLLAGEQVEQILCVIRNNFVVNKKAEITLEMNPGTVTKQKLWRYQKSGVNRLSIGLQSIHDEELKTLGRIHTYAEFLAAYSMAREVGIDNINIDLISAVPGQTEEGWEKTLCTVSELKPEHISSYSLMIEPGTPFYERYGEGAKDIGDHPKLPDEEVERNIYRRTREILDRMGYQRYEISNYARPGFECRHNLGYWERTEYLGFGIGASSLFQNSRYTNPSKIKDYKMCFAKKFNATWLTREEQMEEFMFLGLRKMNGISKAQFHHEFQIEIEKIYGEQIKKLKENHLMEEKKGRLFLTDMGIDVSNIVLAEFIF